MPTYSRLKGISDISESTLSDQLQSNMIEFFNWGMLCIGAFGNVQANASGVYPYNADMSRLVPINDRNYLTGQVWQGGRQDWVWESGVEYPIQPIQVSGVWINNVFYNINTTGTYAHTVDYPQGRIIFDNPLNLTDDVHTSFAYRLYTFQSDDKQWFKQVMFNSLRVDDPQFIQFGSGVWDVLAINRVQLPAVVVEIVPRRQMFGFELGGTTTIHQDILFHIFTENPYDRKTITDIISYQKDKTLPLFDKNLIAKANAFPLTSNGSIASGAKCFPDLVKPTGQGGYYWKYGTFMQMGIQDSISNPPLYQAVVRSTFEVNLLLV
jgi:hypothetical protein